MKDFRKFCRPKTTKNPLVGDVLIRLNCGEKVFVKVKDYLKILKSFKINSVVGETSNSAGNVKVLDKLLNREMTISVESYVANPNKFELINIIGSKYDPCNGHEYVDLGLPSGTKWATMNIGASSETDYGNYYMYGMGSKTYDNTDTPYAGTEDPLDSSVDTASQVWGGSWHMPTRAQMEELTANTTYEWTTINGINGGKFTATNGNYVFFPATGDCGNGNIYGVGTYGYVWSSTPYYNDSAYYLYFDNGLEEVGWDTGRAYGFLIRPVADEILIPDGVELALTGDIIVHSNTLNKDEIFSYSDWLSLSDDWDLVGLYGINTYDNDTAANGDYVIMSNGHTLIIKPEDYSLVSDNWEQVETILKIEFVDLGLPGGLKWSAKNLGADTPEEYGLYYTWGTSTGFSVDLQSSSSNDTYQEKNDSELLNGIPYDPDYDAALLTEGYPWRIPSKEDFETLFDSLYTTVEWNDTGVKGYTITSKSNGNSIFLPAAGYVAGNLSDFNTKGYYWTRDIHSGNSDWAYLARLENNSIDTSDYKFRYWGCSIRPCCVINDTNN